MMRGEQTRATDDQHAEAMEDMRMIQWKLRSEKGASITFALLIFLVCAVVSSAVIVAASTAGGRMSTLKEMDERYYAVTDACENLCDIFDGQTVTVTVKTEPDEEEAGEVTTAEVKKDPKNPINPILKDATEKLMEGATGDILPGGFTQIVTTDSGHEYTCTLNETLKDGTLTFDVSAEGGKTNSGVYRLSVIFASNVKRTYESSTETDYKAIVTWKFRSFKKNRLIMVAPEQESP